MTKMVNMIMLISHLISKVMIYDLSISLINIIKYIEFKYMYVFIDNYTLHLRIIC